MALVSLNFELLQFTIFFVEMYLKVISDSMLCFNQSILLNAQQGRGNAGYCRGGVKIYKENSLLKYYKYLREFSHGSTFVFMFFEVGLVK